MSDTIYRQDAIDALNLAYTNTEVVNNRPVNDYERELYFRIRGKISKLPSAQPHWIPCSGRLPDYGEVVLWCNKHGSVFASAITYQSVDYFSVGKHGGNRTIIAWMPLPKPYGGESDE